MIEGDFGVFVPVRYDSAFHEGQKSKDSEFAVRRLFISATAVLHLQHRTAVHLDRENFIHNQQ